MGKCRWTSSVEQWFDGEAGEGQEIERHVGACQECAGFAERLGALRRESQRLTAGEKIEDSQFPAFMDGVRARIETPRWRGKGLWALASVGAASLIVAVSIFVVITGGQHEVKAQTVVLEASTELEGWEANTYTSENGTATVWVHEAQEDLW